jgi:hypothetical protein
MDDENSLVLQPYRELNQTLPTWGTWKTPCLQFDQSVMDDVMMSARLGRWFLANAFPVCRPGALIAPLLFLARAALQISCLVAGGSLDAWSVCLVDFPDDLPSTSHPSSCDTTLGSHASASDAACRDLEHHAARWGD